MKTHTQTHQLLKQYVRQVIKEANTGSASSHLAALITDSDTGKSATIYDVEALKKHLPTLMPYVEKGNREDVIYTLRDEIIRGYIEVGPPEERGPCRKAWEVKRSAGPGLGSTVYGIGFALSPTGLLIPDRGYVSPQATSGWEKQANKRKRYPLDSKWHHKSDGTSKGQHPHHTDDPSDDCDVHGKENREHLDYAYEALGNEAQILNTLASENERMMDLIPWHMQEAFDYLLDDAGQMFFVSNFNVPT